MKILLGLCLLLVAPFAGAFEYRLVPGPLLKPSIIESHELGRVFSRAGYHALADLGIAGSGLPFDRVFVSEGWQKSFSLKAGLAVPAELEGRPIEAHSLGVIVFHFRYRQTPYLLVSQGVSLDEFRSIVRPWLARASARWSWLLPEAKAQSYDGSCSFDPLTTFTALTARVKDDELVRLIGRCAVDAWSEIENAPAETLRFFQTLATNPEEIWRQTRDSLRQLREFVLDARRELARLGQMLSSLSPELHRQLVCSLVGAVVVQGSVVLVSGSSGVVKLGPEMLLKLKSAARSLEKLGGLEKKGIRLANKRQLTEEVIRCAR